MSPKDVCPLCGGPKYRYAERCMPCRGNHGGRPRSEETRRKIGKSVSEALRGQRRKGPTEALAGRAYAERWYDLPALCERCGVEPPRDRHHRDGDIRNNVPENIAFLCRRCHQALDGRIEILRAHAFKKRVA